MSNVLRLGVLLSLSVAGAFVAPSCTGEPEPPGGQGQSVDAQTEAGAGGSDGGDSVTVLPPTSPFRFPDTPVGRSLASYVALQTRLDAESVALRMSTFAYLRAHASEVAEVLLAVYDQLPEDEYLARWQAIQTLTSLEVPEAAGAFRSILLRDVPPERWSPAEGERSSVAEESILRRRAIEGLKPLALGGSQEAADALRQAVNSPVLSVRAAAVRAYLAVGRKSPARVAELRSMLPESEHPMLERRPATPEDFDVPPPEPPSPDKPPSPVMPTRTP